MRPVADTCNIDLALVVAIASAAVALWTPPFASFGLVVIAAICWCRWLERHPGR
jgi:hypothetical protein